MTRGIFLNSLLILLTSTESDIYLSGQKRLAFKHFLPISHVLLYSLISAFSLRDDASSISLYPIFLGQGSTLPNYTEGCKLRNVTMPRYKYLHSADDFSHKKLLSSRTQISLARAHNTAKKKKVKKRRMIKKSKHVTLRYLYLKNVPNQITI